VRCLSIPGPHLGILRVHILPRRGRRPLASISHTDAAIWVADLSAAGQAQEQREAVLSGSP
jgi:hypothetical protein